MKFTRIKKKEFIDDMTTSDVVYVYGDYASWRITDEGMEDEIVELCESIDIESEERCKCVNHPNYLERITSNTKPNRLSRIYFNESGDKRFYAYKNIRVVERIYADFVRYGYAIYLLLDNNN